MAEVKDLDVLRPKVKIIRLNNNDIDVSFIPCAITWEVDKIIQELAKIGQEKLLENGEETKRAFELSVQLCAVFCEHKFPEMTYEWFMENCDAGQIKEFSDSIKDALTRAYSGIRVEGKNLKAPRKNH
jgi:hypothetical protein